MLYLVGTPIGNLGDLSLRAVETLKTVNFIAAEDTRVTRKLLSRFEIHTPVISYHEHNRLESGERILARLQAGESCALVSDAGMPVISDPGRDLVELCAENGVTVTVVPGPCAVSAGLALSGFGGRYCFEGFLSVAKRNRREHLQALALEQRTMVFYEAPHKLVYTLKDMLECWGDRRIAIAREITKLHEEVLRTTLSEAVERYNETPPKGEFVLIVEGAAAPVKTDEPPIELVRCYIESGMSTKDAVRQAAVETGFSRSKLYQMIVKAAT